MLVITYRVIATCFALTSFAAALIVGMIAENPLFTIFLRALFTMLICYVVGLIIGMIAQSAIQHQIQRHKEEFPIPTGPAGMAAEAGKEREAKRLKAAGASA